MAVATAIDYAPILAPILGLAVLLAAQYYLGRWQIHVRLTETDNGRTALWAHREYSPWRAPVKHYRSVDWDAAAGVEAVEEWFNDDPRFEPRGIAAFSTA